MGGAIISGIKESVPVGPAQVTADFATSVKPFLEEAEHIYLHRRYQLRILLNLVFA